MCIAIRSTSLLHDDVNASQAFDRDPLGFEVREPPSADPVDDGERRPIARTIEEVLCNG
jgi:hypothetical protein